MNPLQLAYVGDTGWEILFRGHLAAKRLNVGHMHRITVASVNAGSQREALERIETTLTGEEQDMVRRGRNAHAKHPSPKHQDPADYQAATGMEALFGYLYMTGQDERLLHLFRLAFKES